MATPTIIDATSTQEPFLLPGMSSPELNSTGRSVRFDTECVLIPELVVRSKLPVVLTKSYSLPLWRRKGRETSPEPDGDATRGSLPRSPSPEGNRLVIKVPIPVFRRSSRSPTRGRSTSTSPVVTKSLSSCLAHRSGSLSPQITKETFLAPIRPSLNYQRRKDEVTVPLRPCCEGCEHIMEESFKKGDNWEEKFSKGAKRRRTASLGNTFPGGGCMLPQVHTRSSSFAKEFSALSMSLDNITESSRYSATSSFPLRVDEVDKRKKSLDYTKSNGFLEPFRSATPPSPCLPSPSLSHFSPYSGTSRFLRERDLSSSSGTSTPDELLPDIFDPRHRLRSSPIEEEDEAQLFPLPSPRRSPSGTPSPSPSPKISPDPSPNGSTSCLIQSGKSASSKDNFALLKNNSSQDNLLKASLSKESGNNALLSPLTLSVPRTPSPNSLGNLTDTNPPSSSFLASSSTLAIVSPIATQFTSKSSLTSPASPKDPRPFPLPNTPKDTSDDPPPVPSKEPILSPELTSPGILAITESFIF